MRNVVYSSVGEALRLNKNDTYNWESYKAISRHYTDAYGSDKVESTKCVLLTVTDADELEDISTIFELAAHDRMTYLFACVCKNTRVADQLTAEICSRIENNTVFEQWSPLSFGSGSKYTAFVRA